MTTPAADAGLVTVPYPFPSFPALTVKSLLPCAYCVETQSANREKKSHPSSNVELKPNEFATICASSPVPGTPSYPSTANHHPSKIVVW